MSRINPSDCETGAIKAGTTLIVTPVSSAIISIYEGDAEVSKVSVSSSVKFGPYLSDKRFKITALDGYADYTLGAAEYENGRQYPSLTDLINSTDAPLGNGEVRQFGDVVYREVSRDSLDRDTFKISSGARLKLADGFVPGPVNRIYSADRAAILSASNPAPIDQIDGVLYGYFSNVIYKSLDEGDSWEQVGDIGATGGEAKRILPCRDGEVLVLRNTTLIKSVNWPNPSEWETKITLAEGQFIEWGLDGNGTKFIAADYGIPHTSSNYLWISLDGGENWTQYEKNTLHPGDDAATHFHGVAYDHIADRFWHCMGDSVYKGHFYSDDDGDSWNEVSLGSTTLGNTAQAVTISVSPSGMILGSDSGYNNGMYRILRNPDPSAMKLDVIWRWPHNNVSVRGFAFKNIYDPVSGITFTCWRTDVTTSPPMITWCNGYDAGILYAWEGTWSANDGIRNVVVLPSGKIKAWISLASADEEVITIHKFHQSTNSVSVQDSGNILGGNVANSVIGLAVGARANAIVQTVAVGVESSAEQPSSVAIGWSTTAGINSTAVGTNADATGRDSVVIGNVATATEAANENVVIGAGSSSEHEDSILVGRSITNSGIQNVIISGKPVLTNNGYRQVVIGWLAQSAGYQNVVVGRTAKCTSNGGTAVGNAAQAGSSGASLGAGAIAILGGDVALGASTTTTIANTVAIGARDLHIQDASKGVILISANGTKYRIKVSDAGALSTESVV